MKLFRINKIICNSNFTKNVIDKEYSVNSIVLYPPVDTTLFKSKRKLNQICYVGRFSNLTQNKGHEVLIQQFKELVKNKKFENWKLILAGGTEVGSNEYLKKLKLMAENYNIEFIESPSFETIKNIYAQSKMFWSAAGFGVDELLNPEKTEHFGITIVEAMSSGCIPVVYNAGGHKEIIVHGKNGFLWRDVGDLVKLTKRIIVEKDLCENIFDEALNSSCKFNTKVFKDTMINIVK